MSEINQPVYAKTSLVFWSFWLKICSLHLPQTRGQQNLFHYELFSQLDQRDPLIKLANTLNWQIFDDEFSKHYCHNNGRPSKPIKQAVCDRGYRGVKQTGNTRIILPGKALKKDPRYQRDKKHALCKRRTAIEPIIGHLKADFRLSRNLLKGQMGDEINVLMVACAWNLRKWLVFYHAFYFWFRKVRLC